MLEMRYLHLVVIGVAVLSLILVLNLDNSLVYAQNEKYKARLLGKNEIPPVNTTTGGRATFTMNDDNLSWKLNLTGISNASAAHIYAGREGQNGDLIIDLLKIGQRTETPWGMLVIGKISASDLQGPMVGKTLADLGSAFRGNNTYVNVLTENHPGGEVRGQIKTPPPVNSTKLQ